MWAFAGYSSWTEERSWDIINGEVRAMTPASSLTQQDVEKNPNKCFMKSGWRLNYESV